MFSSALVKTYLIFPCIFSLVSWFLQMFGTFTVFELNLEKNASKVLQRKIYTFCFFILYSLVFLGFSILNTRAFQCPGSQPFYRRYLRIHSLCPLLSTLLIIIILVVITIKHLQIEVRKETICHSIRRL